MSRLPLENIRILDLTRVLAGPFGSQMLADLGAEVIKIERPRVGDDARIFGEPYLRDAEGKPTLDNAFFMSVNRNKKSISLNIASAAGQEIVRKLVMTCDVFLENYKVGDLKRYGLDYESLKAINPRLIYCSVTGYGQTGPLAGKPGYDAVFQGECGLMSITGIAEGMPGAGPMKVGPSIIDIITGLNVATAVTAALYHRDANGGNGQFLDIALLDCGVSALSHYAQIYLTSGDVPVRRGTQGNGGMPSSMFPCSDGAIMLTAGNDKQYVTLCDAVGRPDLATHPDFCTNVLRVQNRDALTAVFNAIFQQHSVEHWLTILFEAGIPSGPINTLDQVFSQPQAVHRGLRVRAGHPLKEDLDVIRSPLVFSETPITEYRAPPQLGQHTRSLLAQELGLAEQELDGLAQEGVI
ncbi:CoA transferase [Sphingobium sp. LB126]|uniref:CaiB/BaiF CoA transferase family protein n=1 Tax=Sphingobium sp. LB126 TaxID=1983755 RepID=UPI000C2075F8|nr:CaiB/BaiF CoA-transferase family protein [Sphingobium sp. LB126]PJG46419.1 CoA transferase [Sphingobium sp. LB126]